MDEPYEMAVETIVSATQSKGARGGTLVLDGGFAAGVEALGKLSDLVRDARYRLLGQVATLERCRGIAEVLGLRLRAFPSWFVTRTYHLYQLPLLSRKPHVVAGWTLALFFRRDIAEVSMLEQRPLTE